MGWAHPSNQGHRAIADWNDIGGCKRFLGATMSYSKTTIRRTETGLPPTRMSCEFENTPSRGSVDHTDSNEPHGRCDADMQTRPKFDESIGGYINVTIADGIAQKIVTVKAEAASVDATGSRFGNLFGDSKNF
jgi:hypothetical protein